MSLIETLVDIGRRKLKTGYRLVRGGPLVLPSLVSMTLDEDDVILAREWLGMRHQWHENNEEIEKYEIAFAKWNGSKHAFSFMGGRVALSAIIEALQLQSGDEVILPAYTCVVVPNAFHYAGVTTVYSDIELDTYGLDASFIEEKITSNTKAILLHHLYGLVCRDYEKIVAIAQHHNLYVIEDCAHSTGAEYKGKKVGNLGDVAFYSSEHSKVFNTIQGGVAITNDDILAARFNKYSTQAGFPDEEWIDKQLHNVILDYYLYKHSQRWWRGDLVALHLWRKRLVSTSKEEEKGIRPVYYGRKMPAPIAALGLNQLKKIDAYNERRRQTAKRWEQWCIKNEYKKPLIIPGSRPIFLRYPVLVEPERKRSKFWAVKELKVALGEWFVSNIHPAPITINDALNANIAVKQCVNFPCLIE